MRLCHGSTVIVDHPDVSRSRRNLDFGQGFYLTSRQKVEFVSQSALDELLAFKGSYEVVA